MSAAAVYYHKYQAAIWIFLPFEKQQVFIEIEMSVRNQVQFNTGSEMQCKNTMQAFMAGNRHHCYQPFLLPSIKFNVHNLGGRTSSHTLWPWGHKNK